MPAYTVLIYAMHEKKNHLQLTNLASSAVCFVVLVWIDCWQLL